MKIFRDCFGHDVRLTDERLAHIVGHVELIGMESEIERVHMRETAHDALMERVDEQGRVLGFSILGVSRFRKERPFEAELQPGK